MLKPTKEAFLKHDLYKVVVENLFERSFKLEDIPEQKTKKVAGKGARFVYCETDRKDAGMGWFADAGNGTFREGNCGFDKMSDGWAEKNLTEPTPIEGTKFRDKWGVHPEMVK